MSARFSPSTWLGDGRWSLLTLAAVVGLGSAAGALAFHWLLDGTTWLFTGRAEFGQDGRVPSDHLPWLGLAFFVVAPVVGGALHGPLVQRWASEARGHGVPEVVVAVAEGGGRIRPRVAAVKALASAITIGSGGSVGREGPIVQIGAALASWAGQLTRQPVWRLRVLVACGAAGGISATFNAPLTGALFALEVVLREVAAGPVVAVLLTSVVADVAVRPVLGAAPFLAGFPRDLGLAGSADYLLVALLAVVAALVGQLFRWVLYAVEDLCDHLWAGRPEALRPVVGGVALGLLLLAVPQVYGVGYPVMFQALRGDQALWWLLLLVVAKIAATSLTLGIGGSGGVFAPSLFIGLMTGEAFGLLAQQVLGAAAGDPALYAAVGMAGVFASGTRAPLTAVASVVEMTGSLALALPVAVTSAVASAVSRSVSYGTIYTTKLLRRGQDLDGELAALGAADTARTAARA